MKREALLPLVIALAAALGTAATFALPDMPERRQATSEDGRLTVTTDGAVPVSVTNTEFGTSLYRVESAGQPLAVPFALSYSYLAPSAPLAFFAFDEGTSSWRRIDTVNDPVAGTVSAQGTPGAAEYLVASVTVPDPHPNAPSVLDAMLSAPPLGAVGYEASLSVAASEDELTGFFEARTDAFPSRGGCGGTFGRGSGQTASTREIDQDGTLTRILVRWEIDGGCEPGETISPSS